MDSLPLVFPKPFEYGLPTRIVFGNGTINETGRLAAEIGASSVLLVTDAGIVKAGHVERAVKSLRAVNLEVHVYDAVRENPTTLDVTQCVEFAKPRRIDFIVGLGGGSSMDTAKGANFIL